MCCINDDVHIDVITLTSLMLRRSRTTAQEKIIISERGRLQTQRAEQRQEGEGADVEERERGARPHVNTENTVCESAVYICRPESLLPETC